MTETRTLTLDNRDAAVPLAARLAGATSLAAWIMVVAAARWIAYLRY